MALRDLEQAILEQSPDLESGPPTATSDLQATFRATSGTSLGRVELPDGQAVLLWEGTTLIGRDPGAQVRLVDSRVSRQHAEITTDDSRCILVDLASTNGTSVNGSPVSEQALGDGDLISIGGVELRFRTDA